MKFPFCLTRIITLNQPVQPITTERYLLNQLEEGLQNLKMRIVHKTDNELFLQNMDPDKSFRKKNFLTNLNVKVETDQSRIKITLQTNTTLIFLIGICPYLLFFVPNQEVQILFPMIVSCLIWGIGFLIRSMVITEVMHDVAYYLRKTNKLTR